MAQENNGSILGYVAQKAIDAVNYVVGTANNVKEIANEAKEDVSNVAGAVKDSTKDAVLNISETVANTNTVQAIDDTKNIVVEKASEIKDEAEYKLVNAKQTVSDKIDDAKQAVSDKIDDAKQAVSDTADSAKETLKDAAKSFINDVKHPINSLEQLGHYMMRSFYENVERLTESTSQKIDQTITLHMNRNNEIEFTDLNNNRIKLDNAIAEPNTNTLVSLMRPLLKESQDHISLHIVELEQNGKIKNFETTFKSYINGYTCHKTDSLDSISDFDAMIVQANPNFGINDNFIKFTGHCGLSTDLDALLHNEL